MKKKLLAILVSALLLCTMLPLSAVGVSAETISGTTGQCTWSLDDSGHLTISGIGIMSSYTYENLAPWGTDITAVTIEEGVSYISSYAFYGCTGLTSIHIPSSVTAIGNNAFGATSITTLLVPETVKTIGKNAFSYHKTLKTVIIFGSNTEVGEYAFQECRELTTVILGVHGDVHSGTGIVLNDWAFYNCVKLNKLVLGDGVNRLLRFVFWGCWRLPSVTISANVRSWGDRSLECSSLTDVYYTGSREPNYTAADNWSLAAATWHYNCINPAYHYDHLVGHSVMDTENGSGLAFRFELTANGVGVTNGSEVDYTNATVNYLGIERKLVGIGAVITNDANRGNNNLTLEQSDGQTVIAIPVVYVQEVTDTSCAFATRLINIPANQLERTIYARPYYVIEVEGERVTIYGDVDSATCAEYM